MTQTREQNKESCKRYYNKNKEKDNAKSRKYYKEHREELLIKATIKSQKVKRKYKPSKKRKEKYYSEGSRTRARAIDAHNYRKSNACEICGDDWKLEMHHVKYKPTGIFIHDKELEHRSTLCRFCHNSVEGKRTWTKQQGHLK